MEITTYSNFRENLKKHLDMVEESKAPLYVTRSKQSDVVVLSKSEYEGMQETLHLLSSPKNAARLMKGISEYEQGKGEKRDLVEE